MAVAAGGAGLRRGILGLSMVVKSMPLGIVYAIWSGMGIVLVSVAAVFVYQQKLDWPAIVGMGLIIAGVLVINLLSKPRCTECYFNVKKAGVTASRAG